MPQPDRKDFVSTIVLTLVLSSLGFALLHYNLIGYGFTFFVMVPLCIGYFLGKRPTWKYSLFFATLIGLVAFFYLLITTQLEGMFCVVTLFPLLFILIIIGAWIGWGIREWMDKNRSENKKLKLTLFPLLILLFTGTIEHYFTAKYDFGRVESKIFLSHSPETVFDHIKSVDTLDAEKPFLLHLGLSVPQKCMLESESAGAKRICYFKEGTIDEKVIEFRPGEILKMEVTNYGLPGRKWLKFQDAIYLFEKKDHGTVLTRITSYRTELKPRFYWRFWEVKAIEAEHEYVLRDLERRLQNVNR